MMNLISSESTRRPEVLRWHKRIKERYTPPIGIVLTAVFPCSARKPYSKSKSHTAYRACIRAAAKTMHTHVHEVILTSPLGMVPRELEEVYPAAHYDVPVTGHWSEDEKFAAIDLLKDYLDKSGVPAIGLVDGAYKDICESAGVITACNQADFSRLIKGRLADTYPSNAINEKERRAAAVCDYQFGIGAREHLFSEGLAVKGRQVLDQRGNLLATIDRYSGLLSLSLKGASNLVSHGLYQAKLSFNPESSSIFCPGIEKA